MKSIVTLLATVAMLVLGAQARAAIDSDNAINPFEGDGGGELFLSVVDRGASRSYVRDLGITAAEFRANDASYVNNISVAADANLQNLLDNATGAIAWNIAAASNTYLPNFSFNNYGFLTTSPGDPIANVNTVSGWIGIYNSMTNLGSYVTEVNATLGSPANTNYAADVSVLINSPASNAFYDGPFWGDGWTSASMSTEGGLGDDLGFYFIGVNYPADPNLTSSYVQEMLGRWSLSENGTLSYTSDIGAPVPLPAAVWLLGSALLGLAGACSARRRIGP